MKDKLLTVLEMDSLTRQHYMNEHGNELLKMMVQHIGIADDELRDKLNYRLFIELLSEQMFTKDQMNELTRNLIGNDFLFTSIGERDTDSVFTRSFSALWLTGLLNVDAQLRFLSDEEAPKILESCASYLRKEQDVRGFAFEKGWAHAIAHGADLASAVITHPAFELRLAPILLQGIKESFWKGSVFVDDEEERLVSVVEKLIAIGYPEEILIEWVEQVFDKLQFYLYEIGYTPEYFHARTNTLHFMKTFYFALKFGQQYQELRGVVSIFIGKWMKQ